MEEKYRTTPHGNVPMQKLAWPLANELWLDVRAMKVKTPLIMEWLISWQTSTHLFHTFWMPTLLIPTYFLFY